MKELGNRIREERKKLGHTSAVMARILGVSAAYYSRLETGRAKPSRSMLDRIVEHFRLSEKGRREMDVLAGYTTRSPIELQETSAPQDASVVSYAPNYSPTAQPILYADIMYLVVTENGVVIEFGQKGASQEINIVSRIGVSLKHARKIQEVLRTELIKAAEVIEN